MKINIVIAGVGGQGTLLSSKILGAVATAAGYDVRASEVHGMSQRGGSVMTYVRLSNDEKLYSAMVEQKQADFILAFEVLEAVRALPLLKEDGKIIVNTQKIMPLPVLAGLCDYPEDCAGRVCAAADTTILNATRIAAECGNDRAANAVLLGVLSKSLPFPEDAFMKAIAETVKPKFLGVNLNAFEKGRAVI